MTKLFHIEGWYLTNRTINVVISEYRSVTLDRNKFEAWVDDNDLNEESEWTYRSSNMTGETVAIEWDEFYNSIDCTELCESALYTYIVLRNAGSEVFTQTQEAIDQILKDTQIKMMN